MAKPKKFYQLKVKDLQNSTSECVLLTLDVPVELEETFSFRAGQYITFEQEIDGEAVRRSYSLCSTPDAREWRFAIKKVADGRFSTFANERLRVGDIVNVMVPNGHFGKEPDASGSRNYIAFAAGSGITPIYAIIKTMLQEEPHCTFKLFYLNQTPQSVILKEEIEALKNIFMERFEVFHFFTREERDIPFFNGRIDREKLTHIFSHLVKSDAVNDYFLCGPEGFIVLIRDYLLALKTEPRQIHMELFGTPVNPSPRKTSSLSSTQQNGHCEVTVIEGGKKVHFTLPHGNRNILDAALDQQMDLPFACKGGVCSTCRARLLEGEVEMQSNYALEPEEVAAGFILACQSHPVSKKVIVSFDG